MDSKPAANNDGCNRRAKPLTCIQLSIALLSLTLFNLIDRSLASDNLLQLSSSPIHLSWTNKTRYDFVFNPEGNIGNILTLETDSNNYLTNSLSGCHDHSACLFQNGKLLDYFQSQQVPQNQLQTLFKSKKKTTKQNNTNSTACDQNVFTLNHYCSTNWNPPTYLLRYKCSHVIECHSPLKCPAIATNHEKPCYIYDPKGEIIDLTSLIRSDGQSFPVEIASNQSTSAPLTRVKDLYVNVCNEAHDKCGPNLSSCFIGPKQEGLVEAGYNNLTSIKYDAKENSILVTSLGHLKDQCENGRFKTVIRFVCPELNPKSTSRPRLLRSSGCENVIEWRTLEACPKSKTKIPILSNCTLSYNPTGVSFNVLQKITKNTTMFEVPNVVDRQWDLNTSDKKPKQKIILGLCGPLPNTIECGGKKSKSVSACLVEADYKMNSSKPANDSKIVGSNTKSFLRLADGQLNYESITVNSKCSTPSSPGGLNVTRTRQIGFNVKFFCSRQEQSSPTFDKFDDCRYLFTWGTPLMCEDNLISANNVSGSTKMNSTVPLSLPDGVFSPEPATTSNKVISKTASEQHKETLKDAAKINNAVERHDDSAFQHQNQQQNPSSSSPQEQKSSIVPSQFSATKLASNDGVQNMTAVVDKHVIMETAPPKMNPVHKYLMITLISVTLVAFLVVILVLDKKTKLRMPSGSTIRRQARQTFQAQLVPYSRVVDDLDL